MELYARINGKNYPISYGSGFDDQLNETLDSGNIILPHINEEIVMKPYDDIWIYSSGFPITTKKRFKDLESYTYAKNNGYIYHHYLIGNFSREKTYLDGSYYTYNISLVSESKKLETCVMPNRTITQPKEKVESVTSSVQGTITPGVTLEVTGMTSAFSNEHDYVPVINSTTYSIDMDTYFESYSVKYIERTNVFYFKGIKRAGVTLTNPFTITVNYTLPQNYRTLLETIQEFVNSYGHQVRVKNGSVWEWQNEFVLDSALNTKFAGVMAPEMSFNNPTLRQALQQLFLVKDCLPILKDGVITYLDISERTQSFTSIPGASWEQYTMDMSSYSDRLRRTYNNALSQNNTSRFVEKMGFRNTESSNLTLDNMRLEFSHPIYKIKKIVLCVYQKLNGVGDSEYILRRINITPLVLQNSVRNFLSEDWDTLNSNFPRTLEEASKFKFCTVGYNIGDKYITGWGARYSYPKGLWQKTKSYIENILNIIDLNLEENIDSSLIFNGGNNIGIGNEISDNMISPASNPDWMEGLDALDFVSDFTQKVKTLFFEVEYDGFIDGAVQIVKDLHDGNIVSNDATASSLTIVEKDGLFEKEKANRLGNAVKVISARVSSLNDILPLGSYNSDDEIIYKVTTNIAKDFISVSYYLCKDYVLKNYYTAVWAKQRPFALASYGESVSRDENKYRCLLLSEDKCYYESSSTQYNGAEIDKIVSFFKSSNYLNGNFYNDYRINTSVIRDFLVDTQCFTVGNSLCFTVPMIDNVTAGPYIRKCENILYGDYLINSVSRIARYSQDEPETSYNTELDSEVALTAVTGAIQDWKWVSTDKETGFAKDLDVNIINIHNNKILEKFETNLTENSILSIYRDTLFNMPENKFNPGDFSENIKTQYSFKDGKERINTTFQIDAVSDSDNIKISDKFLGMSDMNPNAEKYNENITVSNGFVFNSTAELTTALRPIPIFSIVLPKNYNLTGTITVNKTFLYSETGSYYSADITINSISPIDENSIRVNITTVGHTVLGPSTRYDYTDTKNIVFLNKDTNSLATLNTAFGDDITAQEIKSGMFPAWINMSVNGFKSFVGTFFTIKYRVDPDTVIDRNANVYYKIGNEEISIIRNTVKHTYNATQFTLGTSVVKYKNIHWYICDKLPKYYVDESIPTGATEITPTVSVNTSDKPYLSITLSQMAGANKSVRCYIDGKFVFGLNTDSSHLSYQVYLSLMDSRSLSVLDNNTGEVVGHITNYLRQGAPEYGEQNDYD